MEPESQTEKEDGECSVPNKPVEQQARGPTDNPFAYVGNEDRDMDERTPLWLDDGFLRKIAEYEMNGRQIKNAVRVAHALAIDKQRDMIPEDVFSVVRAIKSFEEEI